MTLIEINLFLFLIGLSNFLHKKYKNEKFYYYYCNKTKNKFNIVPIYFYFIQSYKLTDKLFLLLSSVKTQLSELYMCDSLRFEQHKQLNKFKDITP